MTQRYSVSDNQLLHVHDQAWPISPAMEVSFPLPSGWWVILVPPMPHAIRNRAYVQHRAQRRLQNTSVPIHVASRQADLNFRCIAIVLHPTDRVEQLQRPFFHLDPFRASCIARDMQIGRRTPLERIFAVAESLQMLQRQLSLALLTAFDLFF